MRHHVMQPAYSGGTALSAGSYALMPQKIVHYAWTGSDGVVFQLHSFGPWSIACVNPKDDPREARSCPTSRHGSQLAAPTVIAVGLPSLREQRHAATRSVLRL